MTTLGVKWVFMRELERRMRQPSEFPGMHYLGPAGPLLWLLAAALLASPATSWPAAVALGVYSVYLAYAATRLGAGAFCGDIERLRHRPVSNSAIFAGKLLGSVLPLWIEIVLATPILACLLSDLELKVLPWLVGYLMLQAAAFVIWGMDRASTAEGSTPHEALHRARGSTHRVLWGLPAVLLPDLLITAVLGFPVLTLFFIVVNPVVALWCTVLATQAKGLWWLLLLLQPALCLGIIPLFLAWATVRQIGGRRA
jgi:hypothetical protein